MKGVVGRPSVSMPATKSGHNALTLNIPCDYPTDISNNNAIQNCIAGITEAAFIDQTVTAELCTASKSNGAYVCSLPQFSYSVVGAKSSSGKRASIVSRHDAESRLVRGLDGDLERSRCRSRCSDSA